MRILFSLVTFIFVSTSCLAQPLKVVASFSILADIVRAVAGDKVEVESIVGPNEDAHIYEPTTVDSKKCAAADVIFINGLGFEGWINRLIEASGFKGSVVIASKNVHPLKVDDNPLLASQGMTIDPHAWLSVPAVMKYVARISKTLQEQDPLNKETYHKNATIYLQRLRMLDEWIRDEISKVPVEKRLIISAHDAFGYFSKEYGVKFLAPVGISTEAEPSPEAMRKIIDIIREKGIKTVFVENMTNEKPINMILESTHAKLGGILYTDALSPAENPNNPYDLEPAAHYISLMRHNVSLMVSAMLKS